jgi:hypothetical protein
MAHAEIGDVGRASDLVNEVLAQQSVVPEDRMRANILAKLGASNRAREVAFAGVRERPADKRMVGNFMHLVLEPTLRPAGIEPRRGRRRKRMRSRLNLLMTTNLQPTASRIPTSAMTDVAASFNRIAL